MRVAVKNEWGADLATYARAEMTMYSSIAMCCAVLCRVVLCCAVLCCVVLCCAVGNLFVVLFLLSTVLLYFTQGQERLGGV